MLRYLRKANLPTAVNPEPLLVSPFLFLNRRRPSLSSARWSKRSSRSSSTQSDALFMPGAYHRVDRVVYCEEEDMLPKVYI